jgi:FAD/FMN-containing dehydrogenase
VDHFAHAPSPLTAIFIEQHGGAASRADAEETAVPHRSAPFNLIITPKWDDPSQDEGNITWARALWAAMQPFMTDAVYVNYLGDTRDEGQERIRAAYGAETYDRLASLKRRYDPTNVFRVNQNIAPA